MSGTVYSCPFTTPIVTCPNDSLVSTGACNLKVSGSNLGLTDIWHRGCAYTLLQPVQRPGVYSDVYGTVHYKEPLKSNKSRV